MKTATFVAGLLLVFTLASRAKGEDFCKTTSRLAFQSCRYAAQSDYRLALGKCANLSDPDTRKACKAQAMADYKEAQGDCKDQRDARLDICERLGGAPYDPVINPSNFVSQINNPFLPLAPGTTFYYLGGGESNVVIVTENTKVILGVTCVEVRDIAYTNGEAVEDTLDWFAQDKDGNVWYFGENSRELSGGLVVSLEGSWTAGEDGAKPGIAMKAAPAVGDFYRQEFALGVAEDIAEVLGLTDSVTVPYGMFNNCLKTQETVPLEPDALEHKFYAAGVGLVLVVDVATGERLELIHVED